MFWNPQGFLREILAMLVGAGLISACLAEQDFAADRRRMVKEIDAELASSPNSGRLSRLGPRVRAALAEVPRHEFVPPEYRSAAYEKEPLPIGDAQTIVCHERTASNGDAELCRR